MSECTQAGYDELMAAMEETVRVIHFIRSINRGWLNDEPMSEILNKDIQLLKKLKEAGGDDR